MIIQDKIKKTLEVFDKIESVKTPPFFKDKTMQRLFSEKEEIKSVSIWNWFTPQLQLATLACIVFVNVYAINQIKSSKYEASVLSFASDYGITADQESSLFN